MVQVKSDPKMSPIPLRSGALSLEEVIKLKTLVILILMQVALLAPCGHAQNADDQKNLAALSILFNRDYGPGQELARRNNQYLLDNLGESLKLFTTTRIYQNGQKEDELTGEDALKEELVSRLKAVPHTYSNRERIYSMFLSEGPESARRLTIRQLLRVRLLLKDLERKEFVKEVGSLMEKQPIGTHDEAGGIGTISEGRTGIAEKPNALKGAMLDARYFNGAYSLPPEEKRAPQLYFVHTHGHYADYSAIGAGPSLIQSCPEARMDCLMGDISYAIGEALSNGEFHGLVISRLKGKGFTVIGMRDWYGDGIFQLAPSPYFTDGHPDEIDLKEAEDFGREMAERALRISSGETRLSDVT